MEHKLKTIRQACIAANPEIVELKEGCRIKVLVEHNSERFEKEVTVLKDDEEYFCNNSIQHCMGDSRTGGWEVADMIRVIGRPITLADVLKSFQNKKKCPIGVSLNGDFIDCDDDCIKYEILDIKWDLSLPLSGQSEETIDFIFKMLDK